MNFSRELEHFQLTKIAENEWKVHILGERLKPESFLVRTLAFNLVH